jgi:hypothetical protein
MSQELDNATLDRYARQILVEAIGYEGQQILLHTTLVIQGPPMFSAVARAYLAAAGLSISDGGTAPGIRLTDGTREWSLDFETTSYGGQLFAVGQWCTRVLLDLAGATTTPRSPDQTSGD